MSDKIAQNKADILKALERLITTQMGESMALLEGLKKKRAVNQQPI